MSTVADPLPPPPPPMPPSLPAFVFDGRLRVPPGVVDLATFRAWTYSDDFPEEGRIDFLDGEIWVDLSMEQLYTHNQVKAEVTSVLYPLTRSTGLGRFITDGMRLSNPDANLSTDPDSLFVSYASFDAGRVREVAGLRPGGVIDLEGTPDMVLEIVSDSSERKDYERLPGLYRRAGVPELWRIDVRGGLRFEVLRLTEQGYAPAQEADGWWRSGVFNRSFRLTQGTDQRGQPISTLQASDAAG
jgi:Uma2 family endonuclease